MPGSTRRTCLIRFTACIVFITTMLVGGSKAASPSSTPSDAEIASILAERIDFYRDGVGMVVGVIDPTGRRVIVHGVRDPHDTRPLTGDTQFEIGSITKAFVGLLLENMVRRGEVSLSEPINQLLPAQMQTPLQDGRAITLVDLATHTSALPFQPKNADLAAPNPVATYSESQFAEFISSYSYPWKIGSRFEYSNIGYGLLGYGLGRKGGAGLPALVQERILQPLGMRNTYFTLPAALEPELAPGHDLNLNPTGRWDHSPLFQGSGGLHSSANDLLTFLSAAIGWTDTSLAPDFKAMLAIRRAGSISNLFASVGWTEMDQDGQDMVYKQGGTGGYSSCIAFDSAKRLGVVVLSNVGNSDVCDIAWHLLDAHYPLDKLQHEVSVPEAILNAEVGRYRAPTGEIVSIAREGDHLTWSVSGDTPTPAFPASKRRFFAKDHRTLLAFDFDTEDQFVPNRVVFFQGKGPEVCTRIDE